MNWKARVLLQQSPNAAGPLCDLGEIDLDGNAQEMSRVCFLFHGVTEVGLVETIDFQTTPPTVHISLPKR